MPQNLPYMERYQIYNGLDCCLTLEIFEVLSEQLRQRNTPGARAVYNFERAMQGPALDMMLRGFRIDPIERKRAIALLQSRETRLDYMLQRMAMVVWGKSLNPNSHDQLKSFFYEAMGLPEQFASAKGKERRISTDRESLEKLLDYFYAQPLVRTVLSLKDVRKKISTLSTQISSDGRFRTQYGVANTESGRWNSSKDAFGEGSNLQNISVELRRMFVADHGKKLLHFDQEQAESRAVGLILWGRFGDRRYLNACEGGDLHTKTSQLIWPHISNRESAEQIFYRHFSYRDMSKRGGHLTNYRGTPFTMGRHLKIPTAVCEEFQQKYISAYGIDKWHTWVAKQLQLNQSLTTPWGRERTFFSNPYDDSTLREAIAFEPQSIVAELTNYILLYIFERLSHCELLTQEHDGATFQIPDNSQVELETIEAINRIIPPIEIEGKSIKIPLEFSSGWNWAPADKPPFLDQEKKSINPEGLRKCKGELDVRRRTTERNWKEGLDRWIP